MTTRRFLTDDSSKRELSTGTQSQHQQQLELLIYGNPDSEGFDTSAAQALLLLRSTAFLNSFVYHSSSSGLSLKIVKVQVHRPVFQTAPILETPTLTYEIKNRTLLFPNLTFSGSDGYAYIYITPSKSSTEGDYISSASIIALMNSESSRNHDYILERVRFFDGQALAVTIPGINPNETYDVIIFGTNEDVSTFAFKTPRILFQIVSGLQLPKASLEFSIFTFIGTETTAGILLIIVWLWLFKPMKNCIRKRTMIFGKPAVRRRKSEIKKNPKVLQANPQVLATCPMTVIELDTENKDNLETLPTNRTPRADGTHVTQSLGEKAVDTEADLIQQTESGEKNEEVQIKLNLSGLKKFMTQ